MSIEIRVPEMGESILEATVFQWFKHQGEHVEAGEAVVELETDKVNLEVGAERAGVLARIVRPEGEDVQVGDVLGEIEPSEQGAEELKPTGQGKGEKEAASQAGQVEPVASRPLKTAPESGSDGGIQKPAREVERATPLAQRIAQQEGIDLSAVEGSGPGGRVTKGDLTGYLKSEQVPEPAENLPPSSPPVGREAPAPHEELSSRREERQKMSRRRRTIASRLVEAQHTAAMLTTFNEVDMGAVMELRHRSQSFQERHGVKLGITSFFVKASIGALKAFPRLNGEIDGDEIILKHYFDIGIAVGSEEGLVVPVLREADRLTFAEIEQRIKDFALKAEAGRLTLEDLRGGTFTITNGGVFGSLLSTPILNPPQVGILGLHKIEERPIARQGEVLIRPMMYVALSYDHRMVDGREAVQFLVRIKQLVEDPEALLLES